MRVGDFHVERAKDVPPRVVDADGRVVVPLTIATLANGEIVEVVDLDATIGWECDAADRARLNAFFEAWRRASTTTPPAVASHTLPPAHLLDDLRLHSVAAFEAEIEACRWLRSAPDALERRDLADIEPPRFRDAALEADIAKRPTRENFLRYADLLTQAGDPRGELIRLQATDGRIATRQAWLVLRENARYFFGNFPGADPYAHEAYADEVSATWRFGWVDSVSLTLSLDLDGPTPARFLESLFAWPSARFLRTLSVQVTDWANVDYAHPFAGWTALLAGLRSDSLRVLEVESWGERREDPRLLRRAFPKLERLVIDGEPA